MAGLVDVKHVVVKDIQSGREIPAELQAQRSDSFVMCDLIAQKSGQILGSMTLELGEKAATITTLKNFNKGRIAHVRKELVRYAKDLAAEARLQGVSTFATGASYGFYYSLGFHSLDPEAHAKICEAMAFASETGKRLNTKHVGGTVIRDYVEIPRKKKNSPKTRNF